MQLEYQELEVLALMARTNCSIKDVKDAVQLLKTTNIKQLEQFISKRDEPNTN